MPQYIQPRFSIAVLSFVVAVKPNPTLPLTRQASPEFPLRMRALVSLDVTIPSTTATTLPLTVVRTLKRSVSE